MFSTFEFADNVVGIQVKTNMDEQVFEELRQLLRTKIESCGKINLFLEVEKDNQVSVQALLKHLKFNVQHAGSFNKVAVVTEKNWVRNVLVLKDILVPAEVKTYDHQDRVEAVRWIAE